MKMLEIIALPNGAHRNQTFHGNLPDGWAMIPDEMQLENFPFGEVTVENVTHYRDIEVEREVTKTREVVYFKEVEVEIKVEQYDSEGNLVVGDDGQPVFVTKTEITRVPYVETEEYVELETVTEQEPYTILTLVGWTPLPVPEPVPQPEPTPQPSTDSSVWDELDAAYQEGVNDI